MTAAELKAWRESAGLTLSELAELLETDRGTVYRWEAGKHSIPGMLSLALWALDHNPAFGITHTTSVS